jgi:hypothetical protein
MFVAQTCAIFSRSARWKGISGILAAVLLLANVGAARSGTLASDGASPFPEQSAVTPNTTPPPVVLNLFDATLSDQVYPGSHDGNYGKKPEIVVVPTGNSLAVLARNYHTSTQAVLFQLEPSGDSYTITQMLPNLPMLDRIMGLAVDSSGNRYYATAVDEGRFIDENISPTPPGNPPPGQYRSDIVRVVKINPAGEVLFNTDLDIARKEFAGASNPEQVINPMKAGSARLAVAGNEVALLHTIMTVPDYAIAGGRHQKALSTRLNATTGAVTRNSSLWVSHSFDQRLFVDGTKIFELQLGDAYPRTVVLGSPDHRSYTMFHIKGEEGDNNTHTRLGNLALIEQDPTYGYLALFSTETTATTSGSGNVLGPRNLAIVRVNRNDYSLDPALPNSLTVTVGTTERTNKLRWLTTYSAASNLHAERPKLVGIGNDQYIVLWEQFEGTLFKGVYGMRINAQGETLMSATQLTTQYRLHRGDDAFRVGNSAAWMTAGVQDRKPYLFLHSVDASLTYTMKSILLPHVALPMPAITGFAPTTGPGGTTVIIEGTGMENASVTFNGKAATIVSNTATRIRVKVPAGAGTGPIAVTTGGMTPVYGGGTTTSSTNFTFIQGDLYETNNSIADAKPIMLGEVLTDLTFVPRNDVDFFAFNGAAGQQVTIELNGYSIGSAADTVVELYNSSGTRLGRNDDYDGQGDSRLTYTLPSAGTYYIKAIEYFGGGQWSHFYRLKLYTSDPAPTLSSFTPISGSVGSTVTINGTNLGGTNGVRFNDIDATSFSVLSANAVSAVVPTDATTGKISLRSPGGTAISSIDFIVVAGTPTPTPETPTPTPVTPTPTPVTPTPTPVTPTPTPVTPTATPVTPTPTPETPTPTPVTPTATPVTPTATPETPTPALQILRVDPVQGLAGLANEVVIYGAGLRSDTAITIGGELLGNYAVGNGQGTYASGVVTSGLQSGVYGVSAANPGGDSFTLPDSYTVIDAALPDFAVADSDLWFSPVPVRQDAVSTLGVNVHRSGGDGPLSGVDVAFYLDESTLLGRQTTGAFSAGSSVMVSAAISWTPSAAGTYTVSAVVDPDDVVDEATRKNNTARWTVNVLPPAVNPDTTSPAIGSVTINGGAITTTQQTLTVAVNATDDHAQASGVRWMYIVERVYNSSARAWVIRQESGWVDFAPSYAMALSPVPGVHYLQAWVADAAGNVSTASARAAINYLPAESTVLSGQTRLYRVELAAGEQLRVLLTPTEGDPDLYIWDQAGALVAYSNLYDLEAELAEFTAASSGIYQIEVYGYADSVYAMTLGSGALSLVGAAFTPNSKTTPSAASVSPSIAPPTQQALPAAPELSKLFLPLVNR